MLCLQFLAHVVGKVGMEVAGAVLHLMHYLDEFLLFCDSEKVVAPKLVEFREVLATVGLLISNKSSVKLAFLGKRVNFGNGTIVNTRCMLEDALNRYVLMASRSVTRKSVQRVVGKLIWAFRPLHQSSLFLVGPTCNGA